MIGSNLRLTFAAEVVKVRLRIRGAVQAVDCLRRYSPPSSPQDSHERVSANVHTTFSVLARYRDVLLCLPRRVERFVRTCNGPKAKLGSKQRNYPTEVHGRVLRNSRWIAQCADISATGQISFPANNRGAKARAQARAQLPAMGWSSTVRTGETSTLERVLQATGRYSMRRCGEFGVYVFTNSAASTTTSWSYAHQLKAEESNLGVLTGMSREVVYP
jgi:hypothetical protein